jgi:hypothetical protein
LWPVAVHGGYYHDVRGGGMAGMHGPPQPAAAAQAFFGPVVEPRVQRRQRDIRRSPLKRA